LTEYKIELNGMTCESCEKIIERVAERNDTAVKQIDVKKGFAIFESDENKILMIKQQLSERGITEKGLAATTRGDFSRIKKYFIGVISGEKDFYVETKILNYSFASAIAIIAFFIFAYNFAMPSIFNSIENFTGYVPLIFLAIFSSILIFGSYEHMNTYKKDMSCMNGMMVGMIVGMISGFMVGAIIGATNGMFIGSLAGMTVGIGLGINLGRCCGIMGALEGAMAGLMAGIMGAMTSVMLLLDNLVLFLYVCFTISLAILAGLSYMMFRESGSTAAKSDLKIQFLDFLTKSSILTFLLLVIMLFGPKGPITYL